MIPTHVFLSGYVQAGVTALKFMPFGGLYLSGGVTSKLADRLLSEDEFMEAYLLDSTPQRLNRKHLDRIILRDLLD